ncbi:MAG: Flp pilus assembly protein CpaB [Candidatus Solibacter usitatus]|nr:Flp pilus assembly protein CpaB [Candidatus Solibacter usitatus]
MKRNLMPLLGVAFVAAVVATGIFYGLLIPRLRGTASAGGLGTMVVASRPLDRGAVLKIEDLRVINTDGQPLPSGGLTAAEQAVGLTLLEPVSPNQPVTSPLLTRRGAAGGPSLAIPGGKRAVSVHPIDSGGVIAMLRSGSRVDIQILDVRNTLQLRRLLEDIEVLSVTGTEGGNRPAITLLVKPNEADRLSLADAAMQIRLVLRNPNDRSANGQVSVSPASLLQPGLSDRN